MDRPTVRERLGGESSKRRTRGRLGPTRKAAIGGAMILSLFIPGCGYEEAKQPPYCEVIQLEGSPYERGFQHGQALSGKIASFYRRFLSAGIIPWLNREREEVSKYLAEYKDPKYDNGQFAYLALLESGRKLEENMPEEYIQEMQGIADGSGVDYEQVLILNTFLDTMFGMRSVIMLIRVMEGPHLESVVFERNVGGAWTPVGGVDPYKPIPFASIAEAPTDVRIKFNLKDSSGMDPESLRIQLNRQVFFAGDPAIETHVPRLGKGRLEITFTPPTPLEPARLHSLQVQAADLDIKEIPPPTHANVMRDERIAFTTEGYAAAHGIATDALHEIPNYGDVDERLQPTSLAFGVRGSATADGGMLLGHHFVGLDNDTAHKHGVISIHKPTGGKPFVVVGMAGVIWGSSGMNSNGLAYAFNLSDTLDNPVANRFLTDFLKAKLISDGLPIGILMREAMKNADTADEARDFIKDKPKSFGWNILLADAHNEMSVVEIDSNILKKADGGFFAYRPVDPPVAPSWRQGIDRSPDRDQWGRAWASVDRDDIRATMHYQANEDDFNFDSLPLSLGQEIWTTYAHRSWRTFYVLGDEMLANYGSIDLNEMIRILRVPALNDMRNSMNSAILAPASLKLWTAIGEVPATSAPYVEIDFGAAIGK